MKRSKARTYKKVFANVMAVFLALVYFANILAGEYSAQINDFLGTSSSKAVHEDGSEVSDDEYARYYDTEYSSVADLKAAGYAKVQEVESEGAVLLKNDNDVLPLAENANVSLVGAAAISPVYGGTGSGAVSVDEAPDYLEALTYAGLNVTDQDLLEWYVNNEKGRDFSGEDEEFINEASWDEISESDEAASISQGDVAIFVVGRIGGEGSDLQVADYSDGAEGDYLQLNEEERSILEGLKGMKDDGDISGIVVLLNSANPISSDFIFNDDYGIDAALWIGSVGQTGLYGVADLLVGNANPSGGLPDTWWMDNRLDPTLSNFGSFVYEGADAYFDSEDTKFNSYVVYQEGIYVGYRYTETRYEDAVMGTDNVGDFEYEDVVAFPFGYGLSYSEFELSDMDVSISGDGQEKTYTVTVNVTNTGDVAGKKNVQVYVQKPYTDYDVENEIEKASVELAGYGKTSVLEPGASEMVTIEVPEYYFTSYDALGTGVYILDEGTYYLTVAEDSHAAVNNILAAKGYDEKDGMTADGDDSLVYDVDYDFDATTWAAAYGTGEEVTSLFADTDINRYEGRGDNSVQYVTRSDWEGTTMLWTPDDDYHNTNYVVLSITDQIAADVVLDEEDLPEDDGNWPTMGSEDTSYQLIDLLEDDEGNPIAYDDPMWDDLLDQLTYEELSTIGATGLRMTAAVESIGKPETLDHNGPSGVTETYSSGSNGYAVQTNDPDQEMTGTCYPCNGIIAATFNDELALEVGTLIGEDAMWAGYTGLYGTGLNIHRTPYAGRVFEYYSEDPILTGLIDTQETVGIQSKGVYVYNKHFVLNDQETQRSGISTWCNEQALREIYLKAFELPIVYADAKCIMGGKNRVGPYWSGSYYNLLTSWLRGEAGLSGFVVSDMYDGSYMSKVHEVLAGNDIPDNYPGTSGRMMTTTDDTPTELWYEFADYGPDGSTPIAQVGQALRETSHRILYTVVNSRGMDGISEDVMIVSVTPWYSTLLTVCLWVFAILTVVSVVLLVLDIAGIKIRRKGKKE